MISFFYVFALLMQEKMKCYTFEKKKFFISFFINAKKKPLPKGMAFYILS